jgi:flagellar biosynthetic protein FliR
MNGMRLLAPLLVAVGLAACRYAGFVVASPFPGKQVPTAPRIGLVCVLAWFSATLADASKLPTEIGPALASAAVMELGCGVLVGFTARLVQLGADVLGAMVASSIGLSMPSLFDPATDAHDTPLHRLVSAAAFLVALGAGAHREAIAYLLGTVGALPIGAPLAMSGAAGPLVRLLADSVEVGVRLSLPIVGIGLVTQLSLGVVSRAAPALQVFSVGFSITIFAGLATLAGSFEGMMRGLGHHIAGTPERIEAVLGAASGR